MNSDRTGEGERPFDCALLLAELKRVERLALEKTGIDLSFSDERSGRLLWDLSGLRAGVFSARRLGSGPWNLSLRFNADVIRSVGEERFLPTVAHEYAHAVVHALRVRTRRGRGTDYSPHGQVWKSMMELFGHRAERCHSFSVSPARKKATHPYRCKDCRKEYLLGSVRHSRLGKRPGYLVCGLCRGPLVYSPEERSGP